MTSDSLVQDQPLVDVNRDVERSGSLLTLTPAQRNVFVVVFAATLTAIAVPYPATKLVLGLVLACYWAKLFFELDERFLGIFVLLLPTLQLAPLEALGIPGVNWQTVFLVIFVAATAAGHPPVARVALPGWIFYFSIALILATFYGWASGEQPLWPLLVVAKNWLFPFSLFFVGRRLIRNNEQLWFLLASVAIVSLGMALHGLRDGLTTGHLLTNRPEGLLTGQANLFAGYLAMYGLLVVFASRTVELKRIERLLLLGAAFFMVLTLLFSLSRGAWLAFAVAGLLVGCATNRSAAALLVVGLVVGSRWAPEEASSRVDLTLTAVEQSGGDTSLEEAFDDSAALRIVQWKTFPTLLMESPVWGTGLGTYAQRLGQHTGIYRSAHATMVQIGTEMGVAGLLGYVGLLASAAIVCFVRARQAPRGTLAWAAGLGLLAATVCLFLLDFSGTRFRSHAVTTYFWLLLGGFLGTTDRAAVAHQELRERDEPPYC
jgi:O-antigen ligase